MEYRALTIGLSDELFSSLQSTPSSSNLYLTPSPTARDANHLLESQIFYLLIVDLEYLRSIRQAEWLTGIRRISFVPAIVLSDNPERDTHLMVQIGAGICVSDKGSYSVIADLAFSRNDEQGQPAQKRAV